MAENEIFMRIGLAFIAGLVVGLERESHGRAAGPKTTVLVCVAACLAMILSELMVMENASQPSGAKMDQAHMAAGILTGMGFLGAGSIMRQENVVRGITTAAMLWYVAVLGLLFGSGHLRLGLIGLAVGLVVVFVLPRLERNVKEDWYATVTIIMGPEAPAELEIRKRLADMGLRINDIVDTEFVRATRERTLRYSVEVKHPQVLEMSQKVVDALGAIPGVVKVRWA